MADVPTTITKRLTRRMRAHPIGCSKETWFRRFMIGTARVCHTDGWRSSKRRCDRSRRDSRPVVWSRSTPKECTHRPCFSASSQTSRHDGRTPGRSQAHSEHEEKTMKTLLVSAVVVGIAVGAAAQVIAQATPAKITITSSAFKDGEMIPKDYTGDTGAKNVSPSLAWTGAPAPPK